MAEAGALLRVYGTDVDRFFSVTGWERRCLARSYRSYGPMVAGQAPATPSGLSLPLKDNLSFLHAAEVADMVRAHLMRASECGGAAQDWSTALANVAMAA